MLRAMTGNGILLIGVGTRGRMWRDSIANHERWRLAGIVDVDVGRAKEEAEVVGLGPDRCWQTIEAAFDAAPDARAVVIATPHHHHVDPCLTAIERGVAVLLEKPFAPTLAEGVTLVRSAEEKGTPLLVGQNYRYLRWTRTARSLIDSGQLGRVGVISMRYYRPWKDLEPQLVSLENSVLWGISPHHLDLMRYLTGSDAASISARLSTIFDADRPPGATMNALVTLENGAEITYSATYESTGQERMEGGREFFMRATGDKATMHVLQRLLFLTPAGRLPRPVRRGPRPETEESILLSQLDEAIRSGAEPECSGRDNLRTLAMIEACSRSSAEGAPVDPRELLRDALA
jgi:predicted dehydrogenase